MSIAYYTYQVNLRRAENFIKLYKNAVANRGSGRTDTLSTDILRAGVVFLHSTLEDYLRSIILERKQRLLTENEAGYKKVLDDVSITGENNRRGEGKKYKLSELFKVKEMNVIDIAKEAIKDKVNCITFNEYSDIVSYLATVNIAPTKSHNSNAFIDNYIKRRHKIVHEADKNPSRGRGNYAFAAINAGTLSAWITAVDGLVRDIEEQLTSL